jgi:outer membrane protein TolC
LLVIDSSLPRRSAVAVVSILFLLFAFTRLHAQEAASLTVRQSTPTVSVNSALQQMSSADNPLLGSVPQGQATAETVPITLLDAIDRGLKFNLGLILSQQGSASAEAQRVRALADLLPNFTARVGESVQQINLEAFGFAQPGRPSVVGPFSVFDARAFVTQDLLNFKSIYNNRAANENVRAAQFSYQNTRDLVVLIVGASYLQALANAARVEATTAQLNTAQTVYKQAVDLKAAGMIAGIDVLRAQVEMQTQQQRLLVARNDYDKQMLSLARVIGLPLAQKFSLADRIPYAAPVPITFDEALKRAYEKRSDYLQIQSLVRSAELAKKAAEGERLPTVAVNADYGDIGQRPGDSHGTFTAAAGLKVPIFDSGRIRGNVLQAESVLKQRHAQLDDLRSRIEFEVRNAFLDVNAATEQLQVATSALDVAREQVRQSQDRFTAGVTNNVELVQAQEARAAAEENYIGSLFAHNFAKLSLARSLGVAEDATKKFLGGKQ